MTIYRDVHVPFVEICQIMRPMILLEYTVSQFDLKYVRLGMISVPKGCRRPGWNNDSFAVGALLDILH